MTIREEFFIERQGKRFVLYAGLLEEAHERGLVSVETDLLRLEMDQQGEPVYALVRAKVLMSHEGQDRPDLRKTFTGIGDATRKNVGKMIAPHLIRMAETRAKARALRDAINVGVTALEEIGSEEPEDTPKPRKARPGEKKKPADGPEAGDHEALMLEISEIIDELGDEAPDAARVLEYAGKGVTEARKARGRLLKLRGAARAEATA